MRARVTVVEQVYHQLPSQQPMTDQSSYQRWLDSDEQPYVRNVKIGADWQSLDCGWVGDASLLVLKNVEGEARKNLTDSERSVLAGMVVEVYLGSDAGAPECEVVVYPRESMRLCPRDVRNVMVRCTGGECRAVVAVFPK